MSNIEPSMKWVRRVLTEADEQHGGVLTEEGLDFVDQAIKQRLLLAIGEDEPRHQTPAGVDSAFETSVLGARRDLRASIKKELGLS